MNLLTIAGFGLTFAGGVLIGKVDPLAGVPIVISGFMLVIHSSKKQEQAQ